jgi:hypothetical protein
MIQDEGISIDLEKSAIILNNICNSIKFETYSKSVPISPTPPYIELKEEAESINRCLRSISRNYTIYVTNRRYRDNYFYHEATNTMILSFFGWQHYTNLPLENGLFYFTAHVLALKITRDTRHYQTTGCVYDFMSNKTDVDVGMKMGYICENCMKKVKERTKDSPELSNILLDLMETLGVVSSVSRRGKSVLELPANEELTSLNWSAFEDEVAQLYRELGASVKQNVKLSGFQIDIYLEEETRSKQKLRCAIECKFYDKKIGNKIVNDFSRIVQTLKESKLIDTGIIVSYSGFSSDAYTASRATGVELIHINDLRQSARNTGKYHKEEHLMAPALEIEKKELQIMEKKERSPQIFVIMPLSPDLDDLYYLGILNTARELKCSCHRVDEIEFTGNIIDQIHDLIVNSRIIIAEVSQPNPNVYYEVGYAQALRKPVVLLTKNISSTPFDLSGFNHIIYRSITELQPKLESRLKAILGCNGS